MKAVAVLPGRDPDEVTRFLDVVLGEEPVHPADAMLEVAVVRRHVRQVYLVVDHGGGTPAVGPGTADGGGDESHDENQQ